MKDQDVTLPVNEIIPFSNVDGIGNRTSIFVQGCNLNCVYCHNPETIKRPCEGTQETDYTIKDLLSIIKEYAPYIRGITVSGGEATLYSAYLVQLFHEVKSLGLTCYIDTNGVFNLEKMQPLIQLTDKFLFDVKGVNSLERVTRKSIVHSFDNLEFLLKLNKVEEVRTVCINGYMDMEETVKEVSMRLREYHDVTYKLIRVHHRGLTQSQKELVQGLIPSKKEIIALENAAKSIGVKNVITIL